MTLQRFFLWLWRFNALAIAAASCIALLIAVAGFVHIVRSILGSPYQIFDTARVEPQTGKDPEKRSQAGASVRTDLMLNQFSPVRGTPYLYAALMARQDFEYSSYSSKEASSTRNYVFYNRDNGQSRMLLGDHDKVVVEMRELFADAAPGDQPPKALLVSYIATDSNGDGLPNWKDPRVVALARADGTGLTPIAEAAEATRGAFVDQAGGAVIVMIESGGGVQAVHADLQTFNVTAKHTIAR